jgi:site-specific recombinase XerD
MRIFIAHGKYVRADSGIWIDVKRWGKNNEINIPTAEGETKELVKSKKEKLRLITNSLISAIDSHSDKSEIDKNWVVNFLKHYDKKSEATVVPETPKQEIPMVTHMNEYVETYLKAESRKKHFKTLIRSILRYEMYREVTTRKKSVLYLDKLTPDSLADIEKYIANEGDLMAKYPEIIAKYPYYVKDKTKTPRKQSPTNNPNYEKKMPKNRGLNYVADLMIRFRSFVLWANDIAEITRNNPFKTYPVKEPVYGTPIYIYVPELKQLYEYDLSQKPELEMQRNIFVFQCNIGCRVSDYFSFGPGVIDGNVLRYVAGKTKDGNPKTIEVPLNKTCKEILAKYYDPARKTLFPFISPDKYNDAIKAVCKAAGLNRKVIVLDPYTREGVYKELHEVASSHMARRTLVGNLYKKYKNQDLVSSISGHKEGSRAFTRYRDIDIDMKTDLVESLEF